MRKLEWDSHFWNKDIFQLDLNNLCQIDFPNLNEFIVQALCEASDNETINKLESKGFSFKETKITLKKTKIYFIQSDLVGFRKLSLDDLNSNKNIYFDLFGGNSRFNIFPPKKVNEFYYTWMVNSMVGKMDDECIGYFINSKLAGFVSYRIHNDKCIIGLLGVLPSYQGKGISQLLLNYISTVALNNNLNSIEISTQGSNINALNSYIKNGYSIHSINHWYYYIKGEMK